jgi:hypothetical protein
MPRESLSIEINAPCAAVFAVIHDYDRRLEWDTMLRQEPYWTMPRQLAWVFVLCVWEHGGVRFWDWRQNTFALYPAR